MKYAVILLLLLVCEQPINGQTRPTSGLGDRGFVLSQSPSSQRVPGNVACARNLQLALELATLCLPLGLIPGNIPLIHDHCRTQPIFSFPAVTCCSIAQHELRQERRRC